MGATALLRRAASRAQRRHGYVEAGLDKLEGRDLGVAVAEAMVNLSKKAGLPMTLSEIPGFSDEHIERAMSAAKNPRLETKLRSMSVPLDATPVEGCMRSILMAAKTGDLGLIENMK